ncbi:MAG TPA: hypothetical protein VNL77_03475 [Roseiflexaceae bacterium]|nr:hypothetical protein [Roseiflexaceae bacterium]
MAEATGMTELDLLVGSMFTTRPEEDRELYEEEREWLSDIQDLLREEGVEVDLLSRPGVEIWEGGIERFTDLYTLQLFAITLEQGGDIGPLIDRNLTIEELDDLLAEAWQRQPTARYQHLINHQGDGGYYLPADFAEPIGIEFDEHEEEAEDEEDGAESVVSFGSSIALQRELAELEPQLRQAGVPENHPAMRCLRTLRTAADQSVANDLPIIVW